MHYQDNKNMSREELSLKCVVLIPSSQNALSNYAYSYFSH